jgi:D-alanyl-D-alanine carboxypeptidase
MDWSRQHIVETARELGISETHFTECRLPFQQECTDLISIGLDVFGREQRMDSRAAPRWEAMRSAAQDDQIILLAVSAFRGMEYQKGIIARKLAAGESIEQILRVNALPGFSEHHTGRAIDLTTPGSEPLTEQFELTAAFQWLTRRAQEFGFRMSYPRNNKAGIIYEPWHWLCVL